MPFTEVQVSQHTSEHMERGKHVPFQVVTRRPMVSGSFEHSSVSFRSSEGAIPPHEEYSETGE